MEEQPPSWSRPDAVEEIAVGTLVEHSGPNRRLLLVLAGLLAVVGIGGVVALVVRRSEAVAPLEATEGLMGSMADGDVIGMLEHLDRGERDALAQPMLDVVEELRRLDVLGDGLDPADLTAIELGWDNMETVEVRRTEYLSIVDVRLTGVRVDGDARGLLGGLFDDLLDEVEAGGEDLTASELVGDADLRLALVPDGDDWRVSLTHSLAEQMRREADLPFPGEPVYVPTGSASADALLDDLVDAAVDLDGAGMIGLLDPRELGPVFTYSELFAADIEAGLDQARRELRASGAQIDIDIESESATDEHGTYVTVSGLTASVAIDGGVIELGIEGSCLVIDSTAPDGTTATERLCEEDLTAQADLDVDELLGALPDVFSELAELEVEPIGIRVVELDGRWYLSPIGSMLRAADSGLEAFEPNLVQDLVDAVVELAEDPSSLFRLTEDLALIES